MWGGGGAQDGWEGREGEGAQDGEKDGKGWMGEERREGKENVHLFCLISFPTATFHFRRCR